MRKQSTGCIAKCHSQFFALSLIGLVLALGCTQPKPPESIPFQTPDSLEDKVGVWHLDANGVNDTDNRRIGQFFKAHPDLVGSPEWTGSPEKFVLAKTQSRLRYYWFKGTLDSVTWNAIEYNGGKLRQLTGTGVPNATEN